MSLREQLLARFHTLECSVTLFIALLCECMTSKSIHRRASAVVGVFVGVGIYWLINNLGIASATGISWGVSLLLLMFRMSRLYPSHATGTAWCDKRWTGLGTGLVTLAATIGVSPTLQIGTELRLALGFLVIGAGVVGYTTATMAELEREQVA
jgi:predicted anti-sigma-YlaC factor YlaD